MRTVTYRAGETAQSPSLKAVRDPQGGLSRLVWEGAYANIFIVLTGGAFLAGLALLKRMSVGRQVCPFAADVAISEDKHGRRAGEL